MKKTFKTKSMSKAFILLLLLFSKTVVSQDFWEGENYKSLYSEWEKMHASKSSTEDWFKNSKYGMFIHWGLYAIPGGIWKGEKIDSMRSPHVAEWIMYAAQIPRDEYASLAKQFNPRKFNADFIARLAKDAGMKYVVITSKHHDGFSLYQSNVSSFNVVDASPFQRDIVRELYDACMKHGIDFGVYYSHNIDWMDGGDSQYSVIKEMNSKRGMETNVFGPNLWDTGQITFDEYLKNKAFPQVKEILIKFPNLTTLWYDMARYITPEQSFEFYKIAYELQPQLLVNGRVGNGFGDFDIPGDNKIPDNHENITKPWQTVGTLNNSWGYKSYDHDWKSVKELLFWLVEIVSKGGNYMLNIGPSASGEIPAESVKNLRKVGKWIKLNGEAIYDTRNWIIAHEGPTNIKMNGTESRQQKGFEIGFTSKDFWFTCKDQFVYAISLESDSKTAFIKSFNRNFTVKNVELLGSNEILCWKQEEGGLQIYLPKKLPGRFGYVVKIEI